MCAGALVCLQEPVSPRTCVLCSGCVAAVPARCHTSRGTTRTTLQWNRWICAQVNNEPALASDKLGMDHHGNSDSLVRKPMQLGNVFGHLVCGRRQAAWRVDPSQCHPRMQGKEGGVSHDASLLWVDEVLRGYLIPLVLPLEWNDRD